MFRHLRASAFRFTLSLLADHPPTTDKPDKNHVFSSSLGHACRGLVFMFITERNFRLETVAALAAVALGFILRISAVEWAIIAFNIFYVLSSEAKNTAVELVTDITVKTYDYDAKGLKDVSSGSVLLASISAFIAGVLIFGPRLWTLAVELIRSRVG